MNKLIFKCEVCLKNFRHKRGLDSHMYNCHEVHTRLNCLECNKTFKKSSLNQHMKEQHWTNKKFNCKMCGKHFGLERNLKSHIRNCQGISGPNYDKNYSIKEYLKQQMEEPEMEVPEMEETEMEETEMGEPEMKEQEMAHQGFKCKVCDEDFESERGHRLHMRICH